MKNQDLIELNELNKESQGGTELTTKNLFDRLDREELENVQIITARVRELKQDKIRIYHLHDLALDPEAAHLKEEESRKRFHKLVFSSNWQYQQYRDYLGVPYSHQSTVIETGVEPIPFTSKPKDKIRLIYTSTPHRGIQTLSWMYFPHLEFTVASGNKETNHLKNCLSVVGLTHKSTITVGHLMM